MKYEWRKAEKSLYGVKASPKVVEVPQQSFIMLDGTGNPNLPGFAEEVSALYALASKRARRTGQRRVDLYHYDCPAKFYQ